MGALPLQKPCRQHSFHKKHEGRTQGEHRGSRSRPRQVVRLAADENDNWGEGEIVLTRAIYPSDLENQKIGAIAPGGDYTFMRNSEPIADAQPGLPSAMFFGRDNWSEAEINVADAIYAVKKKNEETYKRRFIFRNSAMAKKPPIRVFGLGLPLFSAGHLEFESSTIRQYDFVGASQWGNQPLAVPEGRGGYDSEGALFASRITGLRGGLARTIQPAEITIVTFDRDAFSERRDKASDADRLAALRWTADQVKGGTQTDLVAIVYDPNRPYTPEEEACIKELLEPEASAVVFLIPKDEPVDMATDQRYAVMRSLKEAGALVVSSVDGNYLRTPLTKAGWGLFDYNVVVGDTEAPSGSSPRETQLLEGTSITAAAAGCAACIAVMHVIPDPCASPRIIKLVLSAAAVDLKLALTSNTITGLEAYRDQCIADCQLSGMASRPQYQSMRNGLGVDAKILRFNQAELTDAAIRICADALVALADMQAPELTEGEARLIAKVPLSESRMEVTAGDQRTWKRLVEAAGQQSGYAELAATADALTVADNENLSQVFAGAIRKAREIILARGAVPGELQWVLGVPDKEPYWEGYPAWEEDFEGDEPPSLEEGRLQVMRRDMQWRVAWFEGVEPYAVDGGQDEEDEKRFGVAGQEGLVDGDPDLLVESAEGSREQATDDTPGESGPASSRNISKRGAANELLGGEEELSWAGLWQYFVDLVTGTLSSNDGRGKQPDTDEDKTLTKVTGGGKQANLDGTL